MSLTRHLPALAAALAATACAITTPVMETGDGTYVVSARAQEELGGATGAQRYAYQEAQKFCAQQSLRPIVVDNQERDIYQSRIGGEFKKTPSGDYTGGFGGSTTAAGSASLRFRCAP